MTLKKNELLLEELGAAPATPATTKWKAYFKSDGLYIIDDAGIETGPFNKNISPTGNLDFATSTELNIASGSITPTQNWHTVDTESDAASDDLDTIVATSLTDGFILILRANNDARTVVIKHNTGNILCATAADITLDDQRDVCILIYDATLTKWLAGTFNITGSTGGGGDVIRTKYIITPSVASNNLTVAIKYLDGSDPTPTNKLTFRVGNTEYELTSAVSFVKNAGTNWHNMGSNELATKDVDLFLYAIGETGASAGLKFGHSRIPHATTMGDFVNTTTSEKYIAGNWTNFNSTDPVTVIGRFRARLSAGAGYTWSIPNAKVINYPILETGVLDWTPAYSASGSMTYTSVTTTMANYQIRYNRIWVALDANGTTGGSASNELRATLPFDTIAAGVTSIAIQVIDAALVSGISFVNAGTPDYLGARKYDNSNFALAAGRYMRLSGEYAI